MTLIQTILTFRKTHTLKETGKQFKLSPERIRQITLLKYRRFCKEHERFYFNRCSHCAVKDYVKMLNGLSFRQLEDICKKESKSRKRDYVSVQRRVGLISLLHKKFRLSLVNIAQRLHRHPSTINHLKNKYGNN